MASKQIWVDVSDYESLTIIDHNIVTIENYDPHEMSEVTAIQALALAFSELCDTYLTKQTSFAKVKVAEAARLAIEGLHKQLE